MVKTAVEPNAPDAATRAARLTQAAINHPVMVPFTGRARGEEDRGPIVHRAQHLGLDALRVALEERVAVEARREQPFARAAGEGHHHRVVRDADAAWHEKFADYDVVLLLNVEAPPAETARARSLRPVRRDSVAASSSIW